MTKLYVPFYFEWAEDLHHLSDAEYGKLIKAIFDFAMGEKHTPKLSREAKMAYNLITSSISRSEKKRLGIEKEQKTQKKQDVTPKTFKRIERKSPTNALIKNELSTPEDTNSENSAVLENSSPTSDKISTNNLSSSEEKSAPTKEQVRNFFKSRDFKSNPDEFFNFYESNGWKVGQNPMKNWHSSAENWESRVNRERNLQKAEDVPHRQGDFDINEAFKLALERSYGDLNEEDDE